jgi:Flp pilus assembly protein protease CpaA
LDEASKISRFFTAALKIIFPVAGLLSAVFWFWSACVDIPQGVFFADAVIGGGDVPKLTVLAAQLAWQSQLNTYAAICAGIAALSVSIPDLLKALKWVVNGAQLLVRGSE